MKKIMSLATFIVGGLLILSIPLRAESNSRKINNTTETSIDVLVKLSEDARKNNLIKTLKTELDVEIQRKYEHLFQGISLEIPRSGLPTLFEYEEVQNIETNRYLHRAGDFTSSTVESAKANSSGDTTAENSALQRIQAKIFSSDSSDSTSGKDQPRPKTQPNFSDLPRNDVYVALLDSGLPDTPPQFHVAKSIDLTSENTPNEPGSSNTEAEGISRHASVVAGAISGFSTGSRDGNHAQPQTGTAPGIGLLDVGITGENENTQTDTILKGLEKVLDWKKNNPELNEGTHIVNLSFVSKRLNSDEKQKNRSIGMLKEGISRARKKGLLCVVPAGNKGQNIINENGIVAPAGFESTLTVGAINHRTDQRAQFSNYGERVDLVAPGQKVKSFNRHGRLSRASGTSIAAGYTSGAAALFHASILQKGNLDPDMNALILTSVLTDEESENSFSSKSALYSRENTSPGMENPLLKGYPDYRGNTKVLPSIMQTPEGRQLFSNKSDSRQRELIRILKKDPDGRKAVKLIRKHPKDKVMKVLTAPKGEEVSFLWGAVTVEGRGWDEDIADEFVDTVKRMEG